MKLRVVLVEPLYEGNVGSVARAMKNFGFHDLMSGQPLQDRRLWLCHGLPCQGRSADVQELLIPA